MKEKTGFAKYVSPGFWKARFLAVLYIVASALALHDCAVIIVRSINPAWLENAEPYILDKLFTAFMSALAM